MSDDDEQLQTLTVAPSYVVAPDEALGEALGDLPFAIRERLTLRGLHSAGGIGEVWRAYDEVLEREVALKRLRPQQGRHPEHRARFTREARLTGQLDHPGIIPVYEYGSDEAGAHCFYTMRFVRGRTLREVIAAFHATRVAQGLPLLGSEFVHLLGQFVSVCNTVAFAHSRKVVHRDLKGDNIIIGDFGEVVVLDWGLAKRLGDDEIALADAPTRSSDPLSTMQGEQLGTPAYMAPEQALGQIDRIEPRTDVYGLAAILFEILTGEPPFYGASLTEILARIVDEPPREPRSLVVDVPIELEQLCLRGLAKAIDDRPASASELGAAVEGWMNTLTERAQTERERERFFELSLDLLGLLDRRATIHQSNAAWTHALGWSRDELAATSFDALVVAEDRERVRAQLDALWAGGGHQNLELRMRRAAGGHRWIDWSLRSLPHEVGLYLVGRDVTDRKQAEQEVEGLLESSPDAMCVIDERARIVRVNAQLERMFGYARAQLLDQAIEVLVPEHLRERHRGHVARFLADPSARPMGSGMSLVGQRADGSLFAVEVSLGPVQTEARLLIACTLRDIGERRRLEHTMMAILDAAPDAMITVDRTGIIRMVNRQTERLFGYPRDALLGQSIELLVPERHRPGHAAHVESFTRAPQPRSMGAGRILHGRHQDGHEFAIQVSLSPVETSEGLLIASAIRPVIE